MFHILKVSHSSVGAALIMTCWPFCFFPFLFPAPVQENLHCSICGYYFGSYDHQKQTMNVSKESEKPKAETVKISENFAGTKGGTDEVNGAK